MRPNIHIEDMTDLYAWLLERPGIEGVYNAGFENISALETAKLIASEIPSNIIITKVKDKRSYKINSDKLLKTGFEPKHSVREAIKDISKAYKVGQIADTDRSYNLRWMQLNKLVS